MIQQAIKMTRWNQCDNQIWRHFASSSDEFWNPLKHANEEAEFYSLLTNLKRIHVKVIGTKTCTSN